MNQTPSPAPESRRPIHTRQISYQCYLRDDGLWDIEGRLSDVKHLPYLLQFRGTVPALEPIHEMAVRVTVDESLTIRDIVTSMPYTPFPVCGLAADPMRAMIGVTIGRGWRKTIEQTLGGVKGCTHLRDLLLNLATAAIQAVPTHLENERRLAGTSRRIASEPPHYLGKCMTWAFDGPTVKEYEPVFYKWKPPEGKDESR
jgi:hypothetical protein